MHVAFFRNDICDGRLAYTGRTVKDHVWNSSGFDCLPKHLAAGKKMPLTKYIIE